MPTLALLALLACDEKLPPPELDSGGDAGDFGEGWCGVRAIFDEACVSCHAGVTPSGDLDLTADPYDRIVGVPSTQVEGASLVVAGDAAGSWLYVKCAGEQGEEGTPMPPPDGLDAGRLAVIEDWIDAGAAPDDCAEDTAVEELYHAAGYGNPGTHGPDAKLQAEACVECHGAALDGGTSEVGCDSCHDADWRTNCVYCHGGVETDGGAPPRDIDGATEPAELSFSPHTTHVSDTAVKLGFACATCHLAPTDVLSEGHVFVGDTTPAVAEVDLAGGLSPAGTWDRAGTCSNLYCHGSGQGDDGDASVAESFESCDGCHPHQASSDRWGTMSGEHDRHLSEGGADFTCGACHDAVVEGWAPIRDPALHVDGAVSVEIASGMAWDAAAKSCNGECHSEVHDLRSWED